MLIGMTDASQAQMQNDYDLKGGEGSQPNFPGGGRGEDYFIIVLLMDLFRGVRVSR